MKWQLWQVMLLRLLLEREARLLLLHRAIEKLLESEERIELPFAGLRPAAKPSIDNSPIESSGKGGFEPPHKVLETFMLPLTSFAY